MLVFLLGAIPVVLATEVIRFLGKYLVSATSWLDLGGGFNYFLF